MHSYLPLVDVVQKNRGRLFEGVASILADKARAMTHSFHQRQLSSPSLPITSYSPMALLAARLEEYRNSSESALKDNIDKSVGAMGELPPLVSKDPFSPHRDGSFRCCNDEIWQRIH